MLPKDFETFRDDFVELLRKAMRIDALCELYGGQFHQRIQKLLEDQFEIVIAGEFQGGKSTLFNALCDGRQISPMGAGTRTSGTIVSASNIADPEQPETAQIIWYEPRELMDGFAKRLLPHLQAVAAHVFPDDLLLDLTLAHHRNILKQAIAQARQVYHQNHGQYGFACADYLDLIRHAAIVTHFWDHEELVRFKKQTWTPDQIGPLIVFPRDWEQRWQHWDPSEFNIGEVLFAFIKEIRIRIHSKNLRRLGCVIVDCPGLFVSPLDTSLARQAMVRADAILYLMDGSRTVKKADLQALEFIRNHGMTYKLFYGINARGLSWHQCQRIMDANRDLWRQQGLSMDSDNTAMFHGLLALRTIQAAAMAPSDNTLAPTLNEIAHWMSVLENRSFSPKRQTVSQWMETALTVSRFVPFMTMVEQALIKKKARTLLIDNGAVPVMQAISETRRKLQARELTAMKDQRRRTHQQADAQQRLRRFRLACQQIISSLDDPTADQRLSQDLWDRLYRIQPNICQSLSRRIADELVQWSHIPTLLANQKRLEALLTQMVKSEVQEQFDTIISGWLAEIKDGHHPIYQQTIVKTIRHVGRELQARCQDFLEGQSDGVSIHDTIAQFSGNPELDNDYLIGNIHWGHIPQQLQHHALISAGGVTGMITASSGMLAAILAIVPRAAWMTMASTALLAVNVAVAGMAGKYLKTSFHEAIQDQLTRGLIRLYGDMKDKVFEAVSNFVSQIRKSYQQAYIQAVEQAEQVGTMTIRAAEQDLNNARIHHRQVAGHVRHTVTHQLNPLMDQLNQFVSRFDTEVSNLSSDS